MNEGKDGREMDEEDGELADSESDDLNDEKFCQKSV